MQHQSMGEMERQSTERYLMRLERENTRYYFVLKWAKEQGIDIEELYSLHNHIEYIKVCIAETRLINSAMGDLRAQPPPEEE